MSALVVLDRCGPGNHAVQLAIRKVQTWALDANAGMLKFAGEKAAAAGAHITTALADMASFDLQVGTHSSSMSKVLCAVSQ